MKYFVLISILLSGCSTLSVPTKVNIPIPIKCKAEDPNIPSLRYSPPYDTTFGGVRDLLGDRELMLAYENELRIALKACK
jgi:hypothetical protein